MIKTDDLITINFTEYEDVDEVIDTMFWDDLYFEMDDTIYIHDTNQGRWYIVERNYHYSSYGPWDMFDKGLTVRFERLDEDMEQELTEDFYKEMD